MKKNGQRIPMVTAYDATGAHWVEAAGIPAILVGDSVGMVVQGNETTLPVTLDEMIYHTRMVVRGTSNALIIGDMPFMSYQVSPEQAIMSAGRLMKEGGAGAIKLEGGAHMVETVRHLVQIGIPVMAHIGLTPQSFHAFGGFRVQGKDEKSAARLIEDAAALEEAGAFALILETIPAPLAQRITDHVQIPTIGIGAGPGCDGQIQVFHDLLGLIDGFTPRHARHYAELGATIKDAIGAYIKDVAGGQFPDAAHSFGMATPGPETKAADQEPAAINGLYGSR
jgi:3-methyl-2-oxobutanoate hydroxymethyltransferase